eukprot:11847257-Heterocapsa_arctica.AAC.1
MDSRVGIGCLAKGRSASRALNSELMLGVPDTIGNDHYAGYQFFATRLNPSDAPTRRKKIPPPSNPRPRFMDDLTHG